MLIEKIQIMPHPAADWSQFDVALVSMAVIDRAIKDLHIAIYRADAIDFFNNYTELNTLCIAAFLDYDDVYNRFLKVKDLFKLSGA